jgi:hypothetical protein
MYDSSVLLHRMVTTLQFLPPWHMNAFETYVRAIMPAQSNASVTLHTSLLGIQSTVQGLLSALSRPTTLINQIQAAKKDAERNESAASRPTRWPLGLLDDTRQRFQDEREERARKSRGEALYLAKELRYTQQTVAGELAGWQDMHDRMGVAVIRDYVRGMVYQERTKLDGMVRALRKLREGNLESEGGGSSRRWEPPPRSGGLQVQDREMVDESLAAAGSVEETSGRGEPS